MLNDADFKMNKAILLITDMEILLSISENVITNLTIELLS